MVVLGEAHWLKPPTRARHHSNHLHEVLVRNMELISHHQMDEFGKGQKEPPHIQPPPRILLSGIHLGWTRHTRPGRTLSQNDWLKTTQKLIPHHHKTRDCKPHCRAVLLGSLTLLLFTQAPFPSKISCFVSTCVSLDNSFLSVRQEHSFGPWKGSAFQQQQDIQTSCKYTLHLLAHVYFFLKVQINLNE